MNNITLNTTSKQEKVLLKDIFTTSRLKDFFIKHKYFFSKFDKEHYHNIKKSINDFLNCRNPEFAKTVFTCLCCGLKAFRPCTCKSRFCPSCGVAYAENWALGVVDTLIDKPHRAALFTLPSEFWNYFITKREILAELSSAINDILKPYFLHKKILSFGLIVNIHTFARDSSFNVHFHIILSEGGFNKHGVFIKQSFFPVDKIKNSWKYLVCNILQEHFPEDKKLKSIITDLYNDDKSFFVNIEGKPLENSFQAVKYFGRYLARPAIAEYRIIEFKDDMVTFWYNDLETQKKETVTIPVFEFMGRLIQQIPPKNFKMVRRFGFYARRKSFMVKLALFSHRFNKYAKSLRPTWREKIKKIFGKDPLICPNCNVEMILSEFHHKIYGHHFYPT